jgi:hypothetical protein
MLLGDDFTLTDEGYAQIWQQINPKKIAEAKEDFRRNLANYIHHREYVSTKAAMSTREYKNANDIADRIEKTLMSACDQDTLNKLIDAENDKLCSCIMFMFYAGIANGLALCKVLDPVIDDAS